MLSVLGTLPFVATIWLLLVLSAAVLEESGAKIAAALKGHHQPAPRPGARIQARSRACAVKPMRAQPQWRAAA
jgi:hypothetical protein